MRSGLTGADSRSRGHAGVRGRCPRRQRRPPAFDPDVRCRGGTRPGDANATGQADLKLNQGKKRICFELSWEDIDGTVVAAHIHEAPPGEPGPIVVPLFEGTFAGTDEVSDCVDVDKSLIKDIRKHPDDYYVNVHSTPGFEAGAVRGQLEKKQPK